MINFVGNRSFFSMNSFLSSRNALWWGAVVALCLLVATLMSGCAGRGDWRLAEGAVWNTTYRITYRAERDMADSIMTVFRQVENSLSPFNGKSLISRINRNETDSTDILLRRVFAISSDVCRESGGRFDPTVSPLVNLWKFGYTGKVAPDSVWEPTQARIDSALQYVGLPDCAITPEGRIRKKSSGTTFNFSAVTKGYACDLMLDMLRRNGVKDAMVEIGGEVAVGGQSPRGDSWRLQIDTPVFSADSIVHQALEIIEVRDCGVATSGNYRNYHQSSAGRVGHTIDPRSGRPVKSPFLSVTVIASGCGEADAYATALMATPSRAVAEDIISRGNGLRVMLVEADTVLHYNWK